MSKNIAVLAAGAIGSCIGADLTKAGYEVLLIDQWPAHVEAMKAHGLRVTMPREEFQVTLHAAHCCDLCSMNRQFDIVFLTAKSYDTRWMVELIKPYLKADGVLVSMQNSLNDEWIAPMIGRERDMACALELSAEIFLPGQLKRNTDHTTTRFVLGELDGKVTPRVQEVAQILGAVGKTEVSTNIWGAKWTKLTFNTMSMALGSIVGIKGWELARNPQYLDVAVKLGRETIEVGIASGYVLEPVLGLHLENRVCPTDEELKNLFLNLTSDVGKGGRSCVMQDLLKGRLTEVSYLNGLVIKKGREVKVPTPLNEAVTSLIQQIEQGKLKANPSNLEKLKQYM